MGQGHLGHTCSLPSKIKPLQSSVCKTLWKSQSQNKPKQELHLAGGLPVCQVALNFAHSLHPARHSSPGRKGWCIWGHACWGVLPARLPGKLGDPVMSFTWEVCPLHPGHPQPPLVVRIQSTESGICFFVHSRSIYWALPHSMLAVKGPNEKQALCVFMCLEERLSFKLKCGWEDPLASLHFPHRKYKVSSGNNCLSMFLSSSWVI